MSTQPNIRKATLLLGVIVVLTVLASCQPEGLVFDPQSGQWVSPLTTPPESPVQTPTPVRPGAPVSSPLPTLTPLPTLPPVPTRSGTPVVKGGPTSTPSPTRPPVLLTPTPVGPPPADLQALYYVADNNGTPELRVMGVDDQGRKWTESNVVNDRPLWGLWGLYPSPDGRYLAAEVAYSGDEESIQVYIIELLSGRTRCLLDEPIGCRGGFWGWVSNNQVLFRPINALPGALRAARNPVLVNIATGQFEELDLPSHPRWSYSLATKVTSSPDSSRLAYSITYTEQAEEMSEIWTMQIDNKNKRLVRKVKGTISALSWAPVGEQLMYLYQSNPGQFLPSELWLLNADGSGEKLLAIDLPMPGERPYRPTWSPNGRYVAFVRLDDPASFYNTFTPPWGNVYIADTTTGQITQLSSFEQRDVAFPTWSPDGKFVAFVSSIITGEPEHEAVPTRVEVWIASADGSQLYAVSETARWANALAWLTPATPG